MIVAEEGDVHKIAFRAQPRNQRVVPGFPEAPQGRRSDCHDRGWCRSRWGSL